MKKKVFTFLAAALMTLGAMAAIEPDTDGFIKIGTAQDLRDFASYVNDNHNTAKAKLTADIDLENVNFTPIGLYSDDNGTQIEFKGRFNGQGHVIRNLRVEMNDNYEAGLFSRASGGAIIENLGIVNATIINNGHRPNGDPVRAGVLGGELNGCVIRNIFSAGTIEVVTDNEQKGGISGEANATPIQNCYTTYDVLNGNGPEPINSFAGFEVEEMAESGELCFRLNTDQTKIVYYQNLEEDEYPTQDSSRGQVYAEGPVLCDGTELGSVTYTNTPNENTPQHQYGEDGYCVNCGMEGYAVTPDAEDWYNVTSGNEMRWVSRFVNKGNNTIKIRLMNDIDMEGINDFPPMGRHRDSDYGSDDLNFRGTFDGQNHIIYNLYVEADDNYEAGFIGRAYQATLRNFGIVNATVINNSAGPVRAGVVGGEIHQSTVNNVWTAGQISVTTDHKDCAGFAGEAASSTLVDCWSSYGGLAVGMNSTTLTRCFFYDANNYPNIAEEAENGGLCYKLNGNTFMKTTWYQTLGEDEYPVLDPTHGVVFEAGDGTYLSAVTPEDFTQLISTVIDAESEKWTTAIVTRSLSDAYADALAALADLSFEDFKTEYSKLSRQRTALQNSASAYAVYQAKVAEVKARVDGDDTFTGEARDILVAYLEENIAPNDDYPNGSYPYIMENLQLSTADVNTETNFVQFLLDLAISGGYKPGTDISSMIDNAKFTNGVKSWTVLRAPSSTTSTSSAESTKAIVNFGFAPFDMSQTVHGLREGLYEFRLGGYTEVSNGSASGTYNYVGTIYADDNVNLIKTQYSDLISEEELYEGIAGNFAERNDYYGDLIGYAPGSILGVANAIDLGHFDNRILAYVKDDSLTVGIHSDGVYNVTNSAYFGNARLVYLGSYEDDAAVTEMDKVIEELTTMSTHMLEDCEPNIYEPSEATNFYQNLKDELKGYVDAALAATTGQEKYAAIGQFNKVFPAIFSCKRAYSQLMIESERLIDSYGTLNPTAYEDIVVFADSLTDIFLKGTASEEEVRQLIDRIKADEFYQLHVGSIPELVDGYYQLGTIAHLAWFRGQVNSGNTKINAVLTNDIDLDMIENFEPIGLYSDNDASLRFQYGGTFDGQGHVIKNLHVNRTDEAEAGFFSRATGATLKNIGIENATVISTTKIRAGVLAGEANDCTIENCFSVGDIYVETEHTQCSGLFAETHNSKLYNCYTVHPVLTNLAGNASASNCMSEVFVDELESGQFCYEFNQKIGSDVYYQTLGEDAYPVPSDTHKKVFVRGSLYCDGTPKDDVYYANEEGLPVRDAHEFDEDGICLACGDSDGEITPAEDGWYEIATPLNLRWFGFYVNRGNTGVNARLVADIDMEGIKYYQPIGEYHAEDANRRNYYTGQFDGQGHVIRNLNVETDERIEGGLFGRAYNTTLKNFGLENVRVVNTNENGCRIGAVVGEAHVTTVENVYVVGKIELSSTNLQVNGIAGEAASGSLVSCYAMYPTLASGAVSRWSNCFASSASITPGNYESYEGIIGTGELCYRLNGGNVENPVWFQKIGTDEYPVLTGDAVVYQSNDGQTYTNERTTGAELAKLVAEGGVLAASTKSYDKLITSADQLSTNCAWNETNTVETLLDGDTDTHFHSIANTPGSLTVQSGEEYIQIDFNKPVSGFILEFSGRTDGIKAGAEWHDTPNQVKFMVSNEPDEGWEEVTTQSYDLPNTHGVYYRGTEPITFDDEYEHLRMYILSVTSNNAYWNLSELQMYDTEESDTCLYVAVDGMKDAVDELENLTAKYKDKLANDRASVNADDVAALKAAIDKVQKLIDEATGIEQATLAGTETPVRAQGIFTLTGVRLSTTVTKADLQRLPKGIYVINGKKVLVK